MGRQVVLPLTSYNQKNPMSFDKMWFVPECHGFGGRAKILLVTEAWTSQNGWHNSNGRMFDGYAFVAYDFSDAHRTSNMVDRLMQRMDRHLFSMHYFHGDFVTAEYSIRGWALIQNFAPCSPGNIRKHSGFKSPAERLNQFQYHENWLQNLLISGSLKGGVKVIPPNP